MRRRRPSSVFVPLDFSWRGLLSALVQELRERTHVEVGISQIVYARDDTVTMRVDHRSVSALKEDHEQWHAQVGGCEAPSWAGKVAHVDVDHGVLGVVTSLGKPPARPPFVLSLYEPDYQFMLRLLAAARIKAGADLPPTFESLAAGHYPRGEAKLGNLVRVDALLREAQRLAVVTAGQSFAIVWGPPGTGKTFTLGAAVRTLVQAQRRVLVLAPTNVAVDQAVLSIDAAFARVGSPLRSGQLLRPGRPGHPELEGRSHLLAWTEALQADSALIGGLRRNVAQMQRRVVSASGAERDRLNSQLSVMKGLLEAAERKRSKRVWELTSSAEIIATTLVSALYHPEVLQWMGKENRALVLDEASMISRAALVPFAEGRFEHIVLFGDPRQLGPIRRSGNDADLNSRYWIGESIFDHVGATDDDRLQTLEKQRRLVMLTDQSRMHAALCKPVSDTFYFGRLKTTGSPDLPPLAPGWPASGVVIVDPFTARLPSFSPPGVSPTVDRKSNRCERSAWVAAGLVERLLAVAPGRSVLAMSPFRNQADLLRKIVRAHFSHFTSVKAGTIHTSQGQEADLVVLDPVNPRHAWLTGGFGGDSLRRLLCVAFSRPRVTIVVLGRRADIMGNVLLGQLCASAVDWRGP